MLVGISGLFYTQLIGIFNVSILLLALKQILMCVDIEVLRSVLNTVELSGGLLCKNFTARLTLSSRIIIVAQRCQTHFILYAK